MGPMMACGVGSIYVSAVLEQVVINFQRIRQGVPHCLTLSPHTMAANYTPGAKYAVYDCLVNILIINIIKNAAAALTY